MVPRGRLTKEAASGGKEVTGAPPEDRSDSEDSGYNDDTERECIFRKFSLEQ